MLNFVKKHISNYLISNNLKSNKRNVNNTLFNFSEIDRIGILFNGSEKKNNIIIKETISYFSSKKISCEALGFVNNKRMYEHNLTSLNTDFFNLNDCSFLGTPKSNNSLSFINNHFDVLINISNENHFLYDYIVTKSNAKLKIGHTNNKYYDLTIRSDINNVGNFVKEVIFYLELINSNNEKY